MVIVEHSPRGDVKALWRVVDREALRDYLEGHGFVLVPALMQSEAQRFAKGRCYVSVYKGGSVYVTGKQRTHGMTLLKRVDGRPMEKRKLIPPWLRGEDGNAWEVAAGGVE